MTNTQNVLEILKEMVEDDCSPETEEQEKSAMAMILYSCGETKLVAAPETAIQKALQLTLHILANNANHKETYILVTKDEAIDIKEEELPCLEVENFMGTYKVDSSIIGIHAVTSSSLAAKPQAKVRSPIDFDKIEKCPALPDDDIPTEQ